MHKKVFKTFFVGKYDIERLSVYYEESMGTTEREFCVKCLKWHHVENNLPCYFIRITVRNFYKEEKKKARKILRKYKSTKGHFGTLVDKDTSLKCSKRVVRTFYS